MNQVSLILEGQETCHSSIKYSVLDLECLCELYSTVYALCLWVLQRTSSILAVGCHWHTHWLTVTHTYSHTDTHSLYTGTHNHSQWHTHSVKKKNGAFSCFYRWRSLAALRLDCTYLQGMQFLAADIQGSVIRISSVTDFGMVKTECISSIYIYRQWLGLIQDVV